MKPLTLAERIEMAELEGATSMLLSMEELQTVHQGLMDTDRLTFIVKNWDLPLDEVRVLTDLAIETMPMRKL